MKSCIEEYCDYSINEIAENFIEGEPLTGTVPINPDETNAFNGSEQIHGMRNEDKTQTEGTVTYDVLFRAVIPNSSDSMELIINVEAQGNYYPQYPLIKRALYYCSRMLSAQYGTEFTGSHYENLKKVYSIWICTGAPDSMVDVIKKYRINEEIMQGAADKSDIYENKSYYDLLSVIMLCFNDKSDKEVHGIVRMLKVLSSSSIAAAEKKKILNSEYGIPMTKELETEVELMCSFSEGIYSQGMEQGRIQGMEQGRIQGIEQGRNEGDLKRSVSVAARMLRRNYALKDIVEFTELSPAQVKKIADKLNITLKNNQ